MLRCYTFYNIYKDNSNIINILRILNMGACNSTSNTKSKSETHKTSTEPAKSKATPSVTQRQPEPQPKIEEKKKLSLLIKQDGDTLIDGEFEETTQLKEIYAKLNLKALWDYDIIDYKTEENLTEKIKNATSLNDVFPNHKVEEKIELSVKYSGLSIPENAKEAYAEKNKLIGTLILDNPEKFGVVVFDTSSSKATTNYYTLEDTDELKQFGPFSAFCNAFDKIYVSGGEIQKDNNTEPISQFMEIDLTTLSKSSVTNRKLPDLKEARTWHSMIYVPDQYIFIVGGTGTKSVEVYDIIKGTIEKDSELNQSRSECTLCLMNNTYLYAFCGFLLHQTYLTSIERCNLRRSVRTWETVNYTLENNITFNPSFFAVSYYKNDIILLGGNENAEERNKNYLYKVGEKDSIEEYNYDVEYTSVFREKFFIPINSNVSVLLPLVSSDVEVFFFNEEDGKVTKTMFKEESEEDK